MRTITTATITRAVADLCIEINHRMQPDMLAALARARDAEVSPVGRRVLEQLLENARVAREQWYPLCQDTGQAVVFVDLGQDVRVVGGSLTEAIQEGVRRGYAEGYLRRSVVRDPLRRENTGDNTPAIVYFDIVPGDRVRIGIIAKGAGCDNASRLAMLTPAAGRQDMEAFVVETIEQAGPNASPPVVVGVGLGGTFEKAALLAKRALLRPVGQPSPDPELAALETRLLERINALGIGPAGFGGSVTALAVHVEGHATHIASFPVAVNLDCHSHRAKTIEL
ncbi:MAG: fumarate hydratase [Armatimonadota bacterium]|nr:fumarate hydratase [Armatimonadota bacterium]